MKQKDSAIAIFILMISFWSCSQKNDPYAETIYRYFREVHERDYKTNRGKEELVVIPLNSCEPCIKDLMSFLLNTQKDRLTLVFTGESLDAELSDLLEALKNKYKYMLDTENFLARYRMNISGPAHLQISDEHISKTDLDINNLSKVLL